MATSKRISKIFKWMTTILIGLIIVAFNSTPSFAESEPPKLVRVGYMRLNGFLYQDENGDDKGLAHDLLHEIAAYNNWKYELVETDYQNMPKQLANEEIDIFIPYQRDFDREKLYEYSNEVFCTNRSSLLTLPSSPICYNDYEHMNGIVIGAAIGTRNDMRYAQHLEREGCKVKIKTEYTNQAALIEALKKGEIDAFISASNRGIAECKIISVLPETNSFVIASKGNRKILDQIDNALLGLTSDMPNIRESLNEKYQLPEDGSYPSLTLEETQYIAKKKEVTVLVGTEDCDENGNFHNSAKVVFDRLEETTGLTFKPVQANNATELLQKLSAGKADIMYSFQHDYDWAFENNAWITKSYANFYDKLITAPGKGTIKKVAIIPGTYIERYVRSKLKYEVVECYSYQECIDAVLVGKADATYCNTMIGNYYSTVPKYRSLSFLSAYELYGSYCMAVSMSSDTILVRILDKALSCLPETLLSEAFEMQMTYRPMTLEDSFYSHPTITVAIIVGVVVILLVLIFLIIYTASIQKKSHQLAIANRAKSEFLARMSHDMRTPMNAILGLTGLSKDEKDMGTIKDNLSQIELSGNYLLGLINDTLDMNKIEAGKLELHMSSMNSEEVFGSIITSVRHMAAEAGVNIELKTPDIAPGQWIPVMADPLRLEQVLMNIIGNAIKFTPAGGTVYLTMETVEIKDGYVKDRYIIRDTGIGISSEFLPHLFEPFSQEGRSHTEREEGTGLGMAIVGQLVELMGGHIDVNSELNKGTEVTIEMKYKVSTEKEKKPMVSYDEGILAGKCILVCEDHPLNAKIVKKQLSSKGVLVELAENGQIGLNMFQQSSLNQYDAILMDIRMPVMNGIEAAKAIRGLNRPDATTVPIIAMTANTYDSDKEESRLAGMNAHLAKPVDIVELYYTLTTLMKEKDPEQR